MMKKNLIQNLLCCFFIFTLLLTSCGMLPTAQPPTQVPGAASTYAALTLAALAPAKTQAARQTADRLTRQAPLPSITPEPTRPTATPMPTNTVPGLLFTATLTPETAIPLSTSIGLVTIIALSDTNCRSGPDKLYDVVGYFPAGQETTVFGRNPDSTWWYIANPDKAGEYCWVWGESTQVTGDTANLEVVIAPTLTPVFDFDASFAGLKKCGSTEYLIFRVTNTGTETLVDAVIQIVSIQNNKTLFGPETVVIPNMDSAKDCPTGVNTIEGKERGFLALSRKAEFKDGLRMRAIIEMCKDEGEEPMCLIKKVEFRL